jgi:HSP20 family protein
MSLIKWNDPFAGMTSMHQALDDIMSEVWGQSVKASAQVLPAVDLYTEDDTQMVAEVHAPSFTKDDIDVNVHDGYLEIKGEKKTQEESGSKKKRNYMLKQSQTSFYKRFSLPKNANDAKIEAHFEDGVLKVVVPFKKLPAPKKITVGSGKITSK